MASRRDRKAALALRMQLLFERRYAKRYGKVIRDGGTQAAAAYAATGSKSQAQAAVREASRAFSRIAVEHLTRVAEVFGTAMLDELPQRKDAIDLFQEDIQRFIAAHGLELAAGLSETSVSDILAIIAVGELEGLGPAAIARTIRQETTVTAAYRSVTIARTETHNAANYASDSAARSTGLELIKEWVAVEDHRTRPSHGLNFPEGANGQRVPMDQPFIVGGASMQYPGDLAAPPEETINCRCVVIYDPV